MPVATTDLRIWEVPGERPAGPAIDSTGIVVRIGFSPNGRDVVAVNLDGQARVWRVADGEPRTPVFSHPLTVLSHLPVLSPDGQVVVCCPTPEAFQAFDTKTWTPLTNVRAGKGCAFSPDGERMSYSFSNRQGRVEFHLLSTATWEPVGEAWVSGSDQHYGFSHDGRRTAAPSAHRGWGSIVVEAGSGARIAEIKHDSAARVGVLSPDGRRLFTGHDDNTGRIWDVSAGRQAAPTIHLNGRIGACRIQPRRTARRDGGGKGGRHRARRA